MERKFSMCWTSGKFHIAILMCIFTVNLADGWRDELMTDILTDGQSSRWNHM